MENCQAVEEELQKFQEESCDEEFGRETLHQLSSIERRHHSDQICSLQNVIADFFGFKFYQRGEFGSDGNCWFCQDIRKQSWFNLKNDWRICQRVPRYLFKEYRE